MSEELSFGEFDHGEFDHEAEPATNRQPWPAFLPKSLADRAREAVADP